ncbi:ABC transporter permease [Pedococcus sp. 2YAF34]|uniref:ABC transporter permease n=1 Tax=Pedococcus sp. 2YAF34 TaxID=3233032 RepID=UPI003F98889B
MSWVRRHLLAFVAMVTLAILLIPNVIVIIFSFNKPNGRYNIDWVRFSTNAWTNPCGAAGICDSLGLSLKIGITASVVATVLGSMVAFALGRHRFRGRASTNLLIFMPMATPEVVLGSSLLALFLNIGLQTGALAILIAHIMFCVSFVVVAVKARVATLDPRLEEAASDLGSPPVSTFMRVTLPLAAPGIAAGALLAFSLSFDDFIITNFNASPSSVTFPMYVWGAAQRGTPVQINVIGTVMFLASVLIVLGAQTVSARRAQRVA